MCRTPIGVEDELLIWTIHLLPLLAYLARQVQRLLLLTLIGEYHQLSVDELIPSLLDAYLDASTQQWITMPILIDVGKTEHSE
jgi:hypothetical protein